MTQARRGSMRRDEARAGLLLISPTVVVVVAVVVLPILWTVMLAFQELRLIQLQTAGLLGDYTVENFAEVFTSDGWASQPGPRRAERRSSARAAQVLGPVLDRRPDGRDGGQLHLRPQRQRDLLDVQRRLRSSRRAKNASAFVDAVGAMQRTAVEDLENFGFTVAD